MEGFITQVSASRLVDYSWDLAASKQSSWDFALAENTTAIKALAAKSLRILRLLCSEILFTFGTNDGIINRISLKLLGKRGGLIKLLLDHMM